MIELLSHDTNIWVLLSFVVFVLAMVKFGGKTVAGALDGKIAEIRREIGTAEKLRKEAQELLAQYQQKQRDAETEAAQIVAFAQRQVDEIRQNAETEFAEVAARREAQLAERLQRIEDKALSDIQNHAAAMAVETARRIIDQTLDDKTAANLTKTAIGDVAKALN